MAKLFAPTRSPKGSPAQLNYPRQIFPQAQRATKNSMRVTNAAALRHPNLKGPKSTDRVDSRLFSKNDHHNHLRRSIQVDLITLGANDYTGHLEGSLEYPEPLTLPQNCIRSLRGDVRPDLCRSGLFSFPPGLLRLFGLQPKPDPTKVQPDFLQSHPVSRD
ncbi:hypothetical protein CRG98_033766 [Punica granatum]|uniref:Uncharacterized protein n=1 Tax=Punica granatum TaxID=22663 RepID=A0A2I0IPB1_PUNGR|nr:hypothetical protein CRG98_033766 [Punica granatum]